MRERIITELNHNPSYCVRYEFKGHFQETEYEDFNEACKSLMFAVNRGCLHPEIVLITRTWRPEFKKD